jgi:hypothetical protein
VKIGRAKSAPLKMTFQFKLPKEELPTGQFQRADLSLDSTFNYFFNNASDAEHYIIHVSSSPRKKSVYLATNTRSPTVNLGWSVKNIKIHSYLEI